MQFVLLLTIGICCLIGNIILFITNQACQPYDIRAANTHGSTSRTFGCGLVFKKSAWPLRDSVPDLSEVGLEACFPNV